MTGAMCSTPDDGFAPEDLRGAGQRLQRYRADRQLLMGSDSEIATRCESVDKARQHLPLKSLRKIGERDIAAKDEIEEALRRFPAEVLMQEFDPITVVRLDAIERPLAIERLMNEVLRQFAETCWREASPPSAIEHGAIDIGRDD